MRHPKEVAARKERKRKDRRLNEAILNKRPPGRPRVIGTAVPADVYTVEQDVWILASYKWQKEKGIRFMSRVNWLAFTEDFFCVKD